MEIGVSIVSHNNTEDVKANHGNWICLNSEKVTFRVVVRDNINDEELKLWCKERGYYYVPNLNQKGFGDNNNCNYEFLRATFKLDYILIINPDVIIDEIKFSHFLDKLYIINFDIMGAKVIEDSMNKHVSQNRSFPALFDPLVSLLIKRKLFTRNPDVSGKTDWVGGSFMLIKGQSFEQLKGFDDSFFMYYEDIDLCKRAHLAGMNVYYNSDLEYFHGARRAGRKIGTRHFYWNLESMFRYFIKYPTFKLLSFGNKY